MAGVGLGASARGLMYVLASFGLRGSVAVFAWQAWGLESLSLLLRGRRGAWGICSGSDVRFGVVWFPPFCRCFCVAGVGLGASQSLTLSDWRYLQGV